MAHPRSAVCAGEGESRRPGIDLDWVTGRRHLQKTLLQRALRHAAIRPGGLPRARPPDTLRYAFGTDQHTLTYTHVGSRRPAPVRSTTPTVTRVATVLALLLLALPLAVWAQQTKTHRIGYLTSAASLPGPFSILLREFSLRELGYVEGANVVFDRRSAGERADLLSAFATELARILVEVIDITAHDYRRK